MGEFTDLYNKKCQYPDYKDSSGCAVFGIINEKGTKFSGTQIIDGISLMHDRSNGLGGGFAAYGIYDGFADDWAFHIIYDDILSRRQAEEELNSNFKILYSEEIPVKKTPAIKNPPLTYRYFLKLKDSNPVKENSQEDLIVEFIMRMNADKNGSYIISSGKNMGIFKGVGFPEDIGHYFRLDEYSGYLWTSHGRFPTNSVGWWGGAHPFGLLNWSVVHNGEISSYGRNKRFVASFGYRCSLLTDTEVIAYLFDLLARKKKIDLEILNMILAAPFWEQISGMENDEDVQLARTLRIVYGGALLNGPFSILVSNGSFLYALNDRIKLRPLVAAKSGDFLFVSSEESAIRKVCAKPDLLWQPEGGLPVIGYLRSSTGIRSITNTTDDRKVAVQ